MGETYAGAGVNIDAGEQVVHRFRDRVRSTFRPEVMGDVGGFGGLFAFQADRYRHPVLVSSTDGVGTKALVARMAGRFDTIGIDLVAMNVDDIATSGAEPLFFLDYVAVGRLDVAQVERLVEGVVEGCHAAGCALIAGEIAEHPDAMEPGQFDLAGFAVGAVERDGLITGERVRAGHRLIGLPSPGLRCNGYSLARRVLFDVAGMSLDLPAWSGAHHTLADELLRPSEIYAPALSALTHAVDVLGLAHITGGGMEGNLSRVLPRHCDAIVRTSAWETPRIFTEIQRLGGVADEEMARVFNMGIGMVAIVAAGDVFRAVDTLRGAGLEGAVEIGEIVAGEGAVRME
jgi:phosphoribosylformylglycinamidine cyclo-ligase